VESLLGLNRLAKIRSIRTRQARDSQRKKLYSWEDTVTYQHSNYEYVVYNIADGPTGMSLDHCRMLIARAWRYYSKGPAPGLHDGRGARQAAYILDTHEVRLPRWARQPHVVLHEVAHGLMFERAPLEPRHGAVYVRVYCDLMSRYLGLSRNDLYESAMRAGLKVASARQTYVTYGFRVLANEENA
jgi:hypothetical protein